VRFGTTEDGIYDCERLARSGRTRAFVESALGADSCLRGARAFSADMRRKRPFDRSQLNCGTRTLSCPSLPLPVDGRADWDWTHSHMSVKPPI
jgi:hypothetical protein